MKRRRQRIFVPAIAAIVLFAAAPADAYLDPGSGSMLLQLLLGGIAGLAVIFRLYSQKLLAFLGQRKVSAEEPAGDDPPQTRPSAR